MNKAVRYYSLLESSGYGLAALDYIRALLDAGVTVYWTPLVIGPRGYQPWPRVDNARQNVDRLLAECLENTFEENRLRACLKPAADYSTTILHLVPEYWPALTEPGKRNIGYMAWETSSLPEHIPPLVNGVDAVMVPAQFNVEALRSSGVNIPISVVPHILRQYPAPAPAVISALARQLKIEPGDFVFYTINEWSARKAIWRLIEAYLDSFTTADAVVLIIKTSPFGPRDEKDSTPRDTHTLLGEIKERYPAPARIELINQKVNVEQITALHALGDCFASTCHAEGWGLGSFEAAGHGNPVLITGWGGQLDYLPAHMSSLIPCREVAVVDRMGEASYGEDQYWAEADPVATRQLMRDIFNDIDTYRARAVELAHKLRQQYASGAVCKTLLKEIHE